MAGSIGFRAWGLGDPRGRRRVLRASYALPTRGPVLTWIDLYRRWKMLEKAVLLAVTLNLLWLSGTTICYALSGTTIAYCASGTERAYRATACRRLSTKACRYKGADLGYAATRLQRRYNSSTQRKLGEVHTVALSAYARAVRCLVLPSRMLLSPSVERCAMPGTEIAYGAAFLREV
eukprot:772636-Rhodomonas_salina.1